MGISPHWQPGGPQCNTQLHDKRCEKVLVKKGNCFSLPFVLQVLLLALAPGHAFHLAQLSMLTQQHRPRHCCLWAQLGDEEKVCLHCCHLVFASHPEHRMVTGVNLHTTHLPECKTLPPALRATPGWQGKVTAPSSAKGSCDSAKATTGWSSPQAPLKHIKNSILI